VGRPAPRDPATSWGAATARQRTISEAGARESTLPPRRGTPVPAARESALPAAQEAALSGAWDDSFRGATVASRHAAVAGRHAAVREGLTSAAPGVVPGPPAPSFSEPAPDIAAGTWSRALSPDDGYALDLPCAGKAPPPSRARIVLDELAAHRRKWDGWSSPGNGPGRPAPAESLLGLRDDAPLPWGPSGMGGGSRAAWEGDVAGDGDVGTRPTADLADRLRPPDRPAPAASAPEQPGPETTIVLGSPPAAAGLETTVVLDLPSTVGEPETAS
jgi:hypothetical protein